MADTTQNLKDAFAGESQANQKYLAFAEKAAKDGLPNIAKLFRTTAQAELIHAHGHLAAMGSIGSTAENLQAAIDGETYEYKDMYPPMLAQAEGEGHKAKRMFGYAVEAEAVHAKLYQMALEAAQRGEDLTETEFYLCPICGHIELGNPPDQCPDLRRQSREVRAVVGLGGTARRRASGSERTSGAPLGAKDRCRRRCHDMPQRQMTAESRPRPTPPAADSCGSGRRRTSGACG
jgi:rubrerythrin